MLRDMYFSDGLTTTCSVETGPRNREQHTRVAGMRKVKKTLISPHSKRGPGTIWSAVSGLFSRLVSLRGRSCFERPLGKRIERSRALRQR